MLREMTGRSPSARDHTLILALELLISDSFGEHLRQCLYLSLFIEGYSGCGVAWLSAGDNLAKLILSRAKFKRSLLQM